MDVSHENSEKSLEVDTPTEVCTSQKPDSNNVLINCNKQEQSINVIDKAEQKNLSHDSIVDDKNTSSEEKLSDIKTDNENNHVSQEETKEKEKIQTLSTEPLLVEITDIKQQDLESTKESVIKAVNLKRKRKTVSTLEKDSPLDENIIRSKRVRAKTRSDRFCWRCHKESVDAHCSACPRSWHRRCIGGAPTSIIQNWICGECATILRAENAETRSTSMAQLSVDQLCMLLKHVVERMRDYPGSEPFWKPVDTSEVPNYLDYVVKPMDLSLLDANVSAKLYGSTDAFMADAKWIQHNCIVFNTCGGVYADTSKLTNASKQIIKLARQEVSEIEACPDCFAHGRNLPRPQPAWFIEPCRRPHSLVWAKLKGFPFWPAKAMPRINSQGHVDVRFFGEHDRAWVSPKDMFLYSEEPPAPLPRKRKVDMDECVQEITRHCQKLELVFGKFTFAPPKVQYDPHDAMQIKLMLPHYDPLEPHNYAPIQLSTPKKKAVPKKRNSLTKAKSENKLSVNMTTVAINASNKPDTDKKLEENKIYDIKIQKLDKSKETNVLPKIHNGRKITLRQIENESKEDKEEKLKTLKNSQDASSDGVLKNESPRSNTSLSRGRIDTSTKKNTGKPIQNLSKQRSVSVNNIVNSMLNKSLLNNSVKSSKANNKKPVFKPTKNTAKIYKPKIKIIEKVNAGKHNANKQNEKTKILSTTVKGKNSKAGSKQVNNHVELSKSVTVPTTMSMLSPVTDSTVKSQPKNSCDASTSSTGTNSANDQSVLLLVVNNGINDIGKQPTAIKNTRTNVSAMTLAKQDRKEKQCSSQKKESKAKKSFPNKVPNQPSLFPQTSKLPNTIVNSVDSMIHVPFAQNENNTYQLLPPEAGPLSAKLYEGAQDLTRRMAQLMEEAYREASKINQNAEGDKVESHQATVHFLRLQIERMQWQHQQQIAELKHNTDRMVREMRASLQAEKLRAVEEVRREIEEETMHCIEEIKRKQWCAMCGREALFYCCWNTAYCDYPCQQAHWPVHMDVCAQRPSYTTFTASSVVNSHQQQHQQQMPRLVINAQHSKTNAWRN